ncbi:LOW QUALITY PROTEIN: cell division protein FtsI [Bacillus sp. JCM 19047]|nr:LOW QUALITY PROTEIN: cell division protein FtsI [Bacillus sp. JCM 19047]
MGESKSNKKHHVSLRLNILFLAVFLLFSALILRLGLVQIVNGEEYEEELKHVSNQTALIDAPRGIFTDRYGYPVVENSLELSVTYTNLEIKAAEILRLPKKWAKFITVDTENLRDRDKREYYYTKLEPQERRALIEDIEYSDEDETTEYQRMIDAISDEMIANYSEEEEQVIAIFSHMLRGTNGSPQRIKQGLTDEEAPKLAEHLDRLPNINIQRDSVREYVYGDTLKNIYGRVGSIQTESVDDYLARGYMRSDLVGNSFLEKQYEDVLRGQKAEVVRTNTREGSGPMEQLIEETPGSRGNDLVLSIDMEYQQILDDIVERRVLQNQGIFVEDASSYAVVMDPKTGDILAMSGFQKERGGKDLAPNRRLSKRYMPGSVVKGASVLAGLEEGVITPSTVIHDRPLEFSDGTRKASLSTRIGHVALREAMARSSNVYMFEIAMRMADFNYTKGVSIFSHAKANEVLDQVKYYFHQFGLGGETGLDLPNEATGFASDGVQESGNLLDFMIGQYDTYTTLQLAQYVSTIANDGVRMRPRLVTEIVEANPNGDGDGAVVRTNTPEVLNTVDMSQSDIAAVQDSFRAVVTNTNGTAGGVPNNLNVAAKTGTAQSFLNGRPTNNLSFVGYAPYDDPEIAFAIMTPDTNVPPSGTPGNKISENIAIDLTEAYYDLQDERNGPEEVDSVVEEVDLFDEQ